MHTRISPASARHAFALAFDLAIRRDALHSLVVPILLRAPWIVALGMLPPLDSTDQPARVLLLTSGALVGDWLTFLVTTAMLRLRARSVFNTAPSDAPPPVGDCYAKGLGRLGWLILTEAARNIVLAVSTFLFVLPGLFLGFRLSFATEAVVLGDRNTSSAFQHSFHLTSGRFERWLEMIAASVAIVLSLCFLGAALSFALPGVALQTWIAVTGLFVTAVTPVIQYAWTFFYLRLVELESPGIEVGPAYADNSTQVASRGEEALADEDAGGSRGERPRPQLALVESAGPDEPKRST